MMLKSTNTAFKLKSKQKAGISVFVVEAYFIHMTCGNQYSHENKIKCVVIFCLMKKAINDTHGFSSKYYNKIDVQ